MARSSASSDIGFDMGNTTNFWPSKTKKLSKGLLQEELSRGKKKEAAEKSLRSYGHETEIIQGFEKFVQKLLPIFETEIRSFTNLSPSLASLQHRDALFVSFFRRSKEESS